MIFIKLEVTMRYIKIIFPLLLLLVSNVISAQIVNIPDSNFKAKLLEADETNQIAQNLVGNYFKIDANNNNEIEENEALAVSYLSVNANNISDLSGIAYFTNLTHLRCGLNQLTSLDISNNTNLQYLYCYYNQLTSLDITNNINLTNLYGRDNQLTTIDVSNNTNLEYLSLTSNLISNLDLSNNSNLETLTCGNNQLTSLNVSNNASLTELYFEYNQITNIDISNNISLERFRSNQNPLQEIDFTNNVNLRNIHCDYNDLTTIDVSNNPNLWSLSCSGNQLAAIDVSNQNVLLYLYCDNNQLTSLDISNNPSLYDLFLNDNQITNIDVSVHNNLHNLNCSNNQLTTLDVSNNINLRQLFFANNQITNIDLTNQIYLQEINCQSNQLTTLDLNSSIYYLNKINCSDNPLLERINFKDGINNFVLYDPTVPPNYFIANNNPNLEFVCVDDNEVAYVVNYFDTESMTVSVNTYCNFNPGGNYNNISGAMVYDEDNNGCDVSDIISPFLKLNINDGTETGSAYTNNVGEYNFYTQAGTFIITPGIENPTFFNLTPIDATITFPDTNNNIVIQDFCITANGIYNDVEIVIAPITFARPGFNAQYLISYKNKGNQILSDNFSFAYDDTVLDYVSATETPSTQTTGILTWDYIDLLPFESRSVYVTLNVNSPPTINIGDQLNFVATIYPIVDEVPEDNTFNYTQTVVGSFDPNDIACLEGDVVAPSEIGEYLHYIINFENTGNAYAENIVVRTQIDPTHFDINTLRILSSSHNADVKINENILEIIFEGINLDPQGQGNILLKIKTLESLQTNDTVTKKANIYFDYNFPIETNEANTTFQLLSVRDSELENSIKIYPNPVKDLLTISAKYTINSLSVFNIQGGL